METVHSVHPNMKDIWLLLKYKIRAISPVPKQAVKTRREGIRNERGSFKGNFLLKVLTIINGLSDFIPI